MTSKTMFNSQFNAYKEVIAGNKLSFESSLANLTGVYTLYSAGMDVSRLSRIQQCIKKLENQTDPFSVELKHCFIEQQDKLEDQLGSKVIYVAFLALACFGAWVASNFMFGIGFGGAVLFGGYSMLKAGMEANDRTETMKIEFLQKLKQA